MASGEEEQVHEAIFAASGIDSHGIEIRTVTDQLGALKADVTRVRAYPLLSKTIVVGGAIFDVHSGLLMPQDV
jgi:carbonic anhydrase